MDSLSQSDQPRPESLPTSPPVDVAPPAPAQAIGQGVGWADWLIRLAVWGVAVVAFARQVGGQVESSEALLPVLIFALLMAGYLLASVAPMARLVYAWAQAEPLAMAIPPLFLLFPYVFYASLNGTLEVSELLIAGVLLFMPVALALINAPALRLADIVLGLITVAMPLVLPLTRDPALDATQALLRAGAFALPVLLLLLSSREQKQRLNFLFVCALLTLWYSVEFDAFPPLGLPGAGEGISYFHLATIPIFLYVLAATGRFGRLGLTLKPSAHGLSVAASNLVVFALIAVPLGLVTGFIHPGFTSPAPLDAAVRALTIYLFVALPEEILFRGALLGYLQDTFRWSEALVIGVSSLIFGAAHLNNPPNVGWYFVLAALAGVFYARTYLATRNVAAAATVHTAVDWLWSILFAG